MSRRRATTASVVAGGRLRAAGIPPLRANFQRIGSRFQILHGQMISLFPGGGLT